MSFNFTIFGFTLTAGTLVYDRQTKTLVIVGASVTRITPGVCATPPPLDDDLGLRIDAEFAENFE
jgi:hypothetical protein